MVLDPRFTRRSFLAAVGAVGAAALLDINTEQASGAAAPAHIGYIFPETYGAMGDDETDDTKAITSAIQAASPGNTVVFNPGKTYLITSTITVPIGVRLAGNGCTLDLSGLNDCCFEIGIASTISPFGIASIVEDFIVIGSDTNLNCVFVRVYSAPRRLIVRDISAQHVAGVVDIRGPTFDALIDNVKSEYGLGTFINFAYNSNAYPDNANQAVIRDCELSNNVPGTGTGIGINVGCFTQNIAIRHCWIEGVSKCIILKSRFSSISDCMLISLGSSAVNLEIANDGINSASGWNNIIRDNTFVSDTKDGTSTAILQMSDTYYTEISGNQFIFTGTIINCESTSNSYNIITDNVGYITQNTGSATVSGGHNYIDVPHDLSITPAMNNISVTPLNDLGSATKFWVSNVTSTTFRINVDQNPITSAVFAWSIV
jgi:hypothetical protein